MASEEEQPAAAAEGTPRSAADEADVDKYADLIQEEIVILLDGAQIRHDPPKKN
ncbi:hypothetical protein R8Z50_19080 [Longispora sp. K20-0274]|uniref:hypothetical protein n=1 Tax=Longispora sp. K20-0274 TaxID=3088255 RepID=UPI00399AB3FE